MGNKTSIRTIPLRGRLAPTPSGHLHLGNIRTFLIAWLGLRSAGGKVVLRIEDIDRERSREAYEKEQIEDLRWLGFDWDEGPDVGGKYAPYRQSERMDLYMEAFRQLRENQSIFGCTCSRKDILLAASAPHSGEEILYPGTCRIKHNSENKEEGSLAWRFKNPPEIVNFEDKVFKLQRIDTQQAIGDFVVYRKNLQPSYQLAVSIDDAYMKISQVVRGADLIVSTARQLLLYQALALQSPQEWAHLPLLQDTDQTRLSKRKKGVGSIAQLREQGVRAEKIIGLLAYSIGLLDAPEEIRITELKDRFSWDRLLRKDRKINQTTLSS